jgi:hypothetical protein
MAEFVMSLLFGLVLVSVLAHYVQSDVKARIFGREGLGSERRA